MSYRTPVSMVHAPYSTHQGTQDYYYAICDDGSVWSSGNPSNRWEEEPPIPGTKRAREIEAQREHDAAMKLHCVVCGHAKASHQDEPVGGVICTEGCHCGGYESRDGVRA